MSGITPKGIYTMAKKIPVNVREGFVNNSRVRSERLALDNALKKEKEHLLGIIKGGGKRNKKRTNKKRTNKKRTTKKRTTKKRTTKKRTTKKRKTSKK